MSTTPESKSLPRRVPNVMFPAVMVIGIILGVSSSMIVRASYMALEIMGLKEPAAPTWYDVSLFVATSVLLILSVFYFLYRVHKGLEKLFPLEP